jgi:hypothetical protein
MPTAGRELVPEYQILSSVRQPPELRSDVSGRPVLLRRGIQRWAPCSLPHRMLTDQISLIETGSSVSRTQLPTTPVVTEDSPAVSRTPS